MRVPNLLVIHPLGAAYTNDAIRGIQHFQHTHLGGAQANDLLNRYMDQTLFVLNGNRHTVVLYR